MFGTTNTLAAASYFQLCLANLRIPLQHQIPSDEARRTLEIWEPSTKGPSALWRGPAQHAIQPINGVEAETPRQPMTDVAWILCGFNISIGNPPQSIRVALSVETPFTMAQSADCDTDSCLLGNHTGFNSSLSSTFEPGKTWFTQIFGWVMWRGIQAKDSITIAELDIPDSPFLLAESISNIGFFTWYFDYDGVFGLSPHSTAWTSLKESGLLEKNIISIKFPSGPLDFDFVGQRDDGELALGGLISEISDSSFIDLPLADGDRAALWATRASSMTYTNKSHQLHFRLPPSTIAAFVTADPFIALPGHWAYMLASQVFEKMNGQFMGFPSFPCELRAEMADLTIRFGEGNMVHNITLSPYEYTFKVQRSSINVESCLVVTVDGPEDQIRLGWPFLRKFYTVFDDDKKLIRLAPKGDND